MPEFQKWLRLLESYGYTNYWKVINATQCGIPQNRERVFCISIINPDIPYEFPEPIPLEKCLEDMLDNEKKIPISYYIDMKKVERFCEINQKKLNDVMAVGSPQPTSSQYQNACDGGGLYTDASKAFQRNAIPKVSRTLNAGCHDAAVVVEISAEKARSIDEHYKKQNEMKILRIGNLTNHERNR